MPTPTRRLVAVLATAAAVLGLAGCAAADSPDGSEPVTLRFAWWGNDARTAATQTLIDEFESSHPNVTIEPEFTDFASYWDKLATATAAKDAPDILQMDEKYLATYGGNGTLMDLTSEETPIDLSDIADTSLATGKVDGALFGIPTGINVFSVVANLGVLEKAGVPVPNDEEWTWDDFAGVAKKVSEAGGGEYYGAQTWGFTDPDLTVWARQHGDKVFDDKGTVVIKESTLASWWTFLKKQTAAGVTPSASAAVEKQAAGSMATSFAATNKAAFSFWWNNQLTALSDAAGSELRLLRVPTVDGRPGKTAFEKAAMYWSISARTDHPAEAAAFVDFLVNDKKAAETLLTERGVPANQASRDHIAAKLNPTDAAATKFLDDLASEIGAPPAPTPPGGSTIDSLLMKYTQQVLFEQDTPAQAAKGFVKDLKAAVADAS